LGGYSGGDALHRARNLFPHPTVIPRAGGVSSTPRPIGSIAGVSGILDRPPSRTMTANTPSPSRGAFRPGFANRSLKQGRRECRVRSRVQEMVVDAHTSIQVQSEHSGTKYGLGQPDCIFRLGGPCSLARIQPACGGQSVSQFSCLLLLVAALMLTACYGVAAWRISGGGEDVTGSASPVSIRLR
jgi:hypothetical protein